MSSNQNSDPLAGWTSANELCERLGISRSTLTGHINNARAADAAGDKGFWLPLPTVIAGRYYWRADDLQNIEARKPSVGRPGRTPQR